MVTVELLITSAWSKEPGQSEDPEGEAHSCPALCRAKPKGCKAAEAPEGVTWVCR